MVRRLLLIAAVFTFGCVFAAPSFAARPGATPHTLQSRHFLVHYTSDPTDPAYTTQGQASTLATLADRAYDIETGWGFTPPNDGDGLVDIYVEDLSALDGVLAYAQPDNPGSATDTGYIVFGRSTMDGDQEALTIAHELFHLIQFETWANPSNHDAWLFEGSAEWAAAKAYGFPGDLASATGPGDISLDCRDTFDGFQMCDPSMYIEGGYSRWPFFQALASRYGVTFLKSALANGAAGMSSIDAIGAAIAAKGGSLADTVSDWDVMQMAGGYAVPTLDGLTPTAFATVSTGATTGALTEQKVPVDHLAVRFLKFTRGDGAADHPCFAATLTITVKMPAALGGASRPYFYWNAKGSTPTALSVSGSTATATLPWDTCMWASNVGYLELPNLSMNVDAVDFVVDSSLAVDTTTPAAATSAPTAGTVYGGQTTVSNADIAPDISVFGPLLLQVSAASPTLRLIVESSGEGKLHALLGSVDLGTPALRPGNNDLRFDLPKALLTSLRRTSAANNVLTLTPVSSSGSATGTAVTRSVSVTPAAHKKTKKK